MPTKYERYSDTTKTIRKVYSSAWLRDHPDRKAAYNRAGRYGLTDEDYADLLSYQGARCAICGNVSKLSIDHDHTTGKVRGLLCQACNTRLGLIEQPALHDAAQDYLASPPADEVLTQTQVGE